MSDQEPAARPCPFCKQDVRADLSRPTRRLLLPSDTEAAGDAPDAGPPDAGPAPAATCPGFIIDTDPEGSGLGIWVLVETGPNDCGYAYAGGIV